MSTKTAIGIMIVAFAASALACSKDKPKAAPVEAKAECRLIGAWTIDGAAQQVEDNKKISANITFSSTGDTFGVGKLNQGSAKSDLKITGSKADLKTIEDGQASTVKFETSIDGVGGDCKLQFVDECENLKVTCGSRTMTINRAKE